MSTLTKNPTTPRRENILALASRIEDIDLEMQVAIESGEFETASKLSEEQERLLEYLMLIQARG